LQERDRKVSNEPKNKLPDPLKLENKRLEKSLKDYTEKYDKLRKSFTKYKDDVVNGRNPSQKQISDENKRLKKSESELTQKYEKLQKLYEEANIKGPKIQARKDQIDALQTELNEKQIQWDNLQQIYLKKLQNTNR